MLESLNIVENSYAFVATIHQSFPWRSSWSSWTRQWVQLVSRCTFDTRTASDRCGVNKAVQCIAVGTPPWWPGPCGRAGRFVTAVSSLPFRRRRFVAGTLRHQPFRRGYTPSPVISSRVYTSSPSCRFFAGTLRRWSTKKTVEVRTVCKLYLYIVYARLVNIIHV